MEKTYWFLSRAAYEPLLEQFEITEEDYLAAMQEVANLFPAEKSATYYRNTVEKLGSLTHFDLIPHPNQTLPYNPVPILLNVNGAGILSQLLYLGRSEERRVGKECRSRWSPYH